jgi:hypothetical protein
MTNKPVKISVMGRRQSNIDLNRTAWGRFKYNVVLWFKRIVKLLTFTGFVYGVFVLGGVLNPNLQYQTVEAIKEVESKAPIMERIINCESGGKQFDKNGQVLMRSNTNKTVDVGLGQINTVWFAKATELGYDLTTEQGNRAMVYWIYKNKGTAPWASSSKCWNK